MSQKEYHNPSYLYVGQIVYVDARLVDANVKPGTGLRCTVEVAHGDAGVVVNESHNFRRLLRIDRLWVPPTPRPPAEASPCDD